MSVRDWVWFILMVLVWAAFFVYQPETTFRTTAVGVTIMATYNLVKAESHAAEKQ